MSFEKKIRMIAIDDELSTHKSRIGYRARIHPDDNVKYHLKP